MLLRPRQQVFVDRCLTALRSNQDTLGVAPTGAGKTVMLAAVAGEFDRVLVNQHRDELLRQNRATYRKVTNRLTSRFDSVKRDWSDSTFASVQTLVRHLDEMRPADLMIIDEAHHAPAPTYVKIWNRAKELNPKIKLLGVTATPQRGDRKGLGKSFSNLADKITLAELIVSGHLVEPKAYVMDVGLDEQLSEVRRTCNGRGDYDMAAVEALLDVQPVTNSVISHWKEKAIKRQTIVFCSTVAHSEHVCQAFNLAGVKAVSVTGDTPKVERKRLLAAFHSGAVQVLCNVGIATEGYDCPPISCVILLRPSSFISTMIQIIGRGLRIAPPDLYPGACKTNCLVLDFGRSLLTHGGIDSVCDLTTFDPADHAGEAPTKTCKCGCKVPLRTRQCPLCGYERPEFLPPSNSESAAAAAALGLKACAMSLT